MKIILKDDWDVSLRPPLFGNDVVGHFAGRNKEILRLVNELLRKNSGSIVVTGHRGVGKTSFVYKALSDVYEKDECDILIVLLNAGQFEISSEKGTINPKEVLINIIRRLYSSSQNWDLEDNIKSKIEVLYRKAVAKNYNFVDSHSAIDEHINISENSKKINIRFEHIIYPVFLIIAYIFQTKEILPSVRLNEIVPLILALPVPYIIYLSYIKWSSDKTQKINRDKVNEFYEFDSNIGNLEFDLEEIHNDVSKSEKKIIYVIDELDKISVENTSKIIKYSKNLFTLSDAQFIFVTGEETYNHFENHGENEYRPNEYTYFTSKYFLSRPLTDDLNSYLGDIIETNELSEKDSEIFTKALCFESHNDFFDLKKFIKDRIISFDGLKPIIKFENITEDDVQKARFQHAITILFEEKYMSLKQSKWDENEHMLRALYKHAHDIYSSYSEDIFYDPDEDSNIAEIQRDFNRLLQRCEAFDVVSETSKNIKGLDVSIVEYRYSGSIQIDPPTPLDEPMEFERRFINTFETYRRYIIDIINAFETTKNGNEVDVDTFVESQIKYMDRISGWGFKHLKQYNAHYRIYSEIVGQIPFLDYKREGIIKRTHEIENLTNAMLATLPIIIGRMVQDLYSELDLQFQDLNQNTSLLGGSKNEIRINYLNTNPHVLFNKDLSHQISIHNNKKNLLNHFKNDIRANDISINFFDSTKSTKEVDSCAINTKNPDVFAKSILELLNHAKRFFKM